MTDGGKSLVGDHVYRGCVLLIVHGKQDNVCPPQASQELYTEFYSRCDARIKQGACC